MQEELLDPLSCYELIKSKTPHYNEDTEVFVQESRTLKMNSIYNGIIIYITFKRIHLREL